MPTQSKYGNQLMKQVGGSNSYQAASIVANACHGCPIISKASFLVNSPSTTTTDIQVTVSSGTFYA